VIGCEKEQSNSNNPRNANNKKRRRITLAVSIVFPSSGYWSEQRSALRTRRQSGIGAEKANQDVHVIESARWNIGERYREANKSSIAVDHHAGWRTERNNYRGTFVEAMEGGGYSEKAWQERDNLIYERASHFLNVVYLRGIRLI
jgi:hypothetical protein